jgi:hypothetical protein
VEEEVVVRRVSSGLLRGQLEKVRVGNGLRLRGWDSYGLARGTIRVDKQVLLRLSMIDWRLS